MDKEGLLMNKGLRQWIWKKRLILNLSTLMTLSHYRAFRNRFPVETTEEINVKMEELANELEEEAKSDKKYNAYSDKQRSVFFYFNQIKLWKAAPSARKTQVEIRTAQKWAKRLKEDPEWNIYEKQTNMFNREPSQLQEEHKKHLLDFFDKYPKQQGMMQWKA